MLSWMLSCHPIPTASATPASLVHDDDAGAFAVNLETIAPDIVRGRANITVVGDSINNFGQADWMYTGYLLEWRPHRWRQVHVNPVSSAYTVAAWAAYSSTATFTILHPGQSKPGVGEFVGSLPTTMRVIQSPNWSGRAFAGGVHKTSFVLEDDGVMLDADDQARFLRSGNAERHRVMLVVSDENASRLCWTIKCRNSSAGTTPERVHLDQCFPSSDVPRLVWREFTIDGSTEGLGHVADELHIGSAGPLQKQERVGFAGSVMTDADIDRGLGLTYVGQGGWRVGNHAYPTGHPDVPVINQFNPYPGSYSDEALRRHILAHETTHFLVWLGTNNGGVDADDPGRTVETMTVLLDRYRRIHAEARMENPDLPEPGFLLVSPYCVNDDCSFFREFADGLRGLATKDVAFIDLRAIVETHFGDWSEWRAKFLVDSVHPSRAGSRTFARAIWKQLVEAAGLATDLSRDGKVDGVDFGLMLQQYENEGPFELGDFSGDGRVGGKDLGLLLMDWGRTID